MTVSIPGTRTQLPPEDSQPGPREAVSARATITSVTEERRRVIGRRVRELTEELRRLVFEDSILAAHEMVAGVNQEAAE